MQTAVLSHFTSLRTLVLQDEISIRLENQGSSRPSPDISPSICSLLVLPTSRCPHLHQITFELQLDPTPEHDGFTFLAALSVWEVIDSSLSQERFPSLHRVIFKFGVDRMSYVSNDFSYVVDGVVQCPALPRKVQSPSWEEAVPVVMQCLPRLAARNCLRFEPLRSVLRFLWRSSLLSPSL